MRLHVKPRCIPEVIAVDGRRQSLTLLPEGVGSSKLHSSFRRIQFPQGVLSSHLTRRCLHRLQPLLDFLVPSCVMLHLLCASSVDRTENSNMNFRDCEEVLL